MNASRFLIGISSILIIGSLHLGTVFAQTDEAAPVSSDAKTADSKLSEANVIDAKPAEPKPVDAKTAEDKTSQTKPAESKTPESKATDTKAVDSKSSDSKPIDPKTPVETTPPAQAGGADDGEYEIDYEEEPGTEGEEPEEEAPVKQKANNRKKISNASPGGGAGGIQGSRAKHRFTPILKSETKSVYKKDGKALDVDSD